MSDFTNAMIGILPRDTDITIQDVVNSALATVQKQFPAWKDDRPLAGSHRTFDAIDFTRAMAAHGSYCGVAISLMWLDFLSFSPIGYLPSHGAVADRLAQMTSTQITPKTTVVVYVVDKTTAPKAGELKRLNADIDVIVALLKVAQAIELYNSDQTEQTRAVMNDYYVTVRHVVVDFHYVEPTPDIQRVIFTKAFQLLEDVKITEEEKSQSAWETSCSFHRVREDNTRVTGDASSAKVHEFMASRITFAKGSDYACRANDTHSKGADNALLVYDKITRAEVVCLVEAAKHEFGLRSPLTQISKLILVCQKAGADLCRVRWLISLVYHRLKCNIMDVNVSYSYLRVHLLPEALLMHELVSSIPPLLPYPLESDGKLPIDTVWVTSASANAMWYARRLSTKDMVYGMALDLSPSASMAIAFMNSLYQGEEDRVFPDMLVNCKAMTAIQKLSYYSLNGGAFKDRLMDQFRIDTRIPLVNAYDNGVDDGDDLPAAVVDPDLLERDRKLQELMSLKPMQRSKDVTYMAWMCHAMDVTCKCGMICACK